MARVHRRYGKKRRQTSESSPRRNPPLMTDLVEWVAPGFAGFAVTRFATRVAATQIAKKKPSWGKHVGAGVSVGAFLAAWFLAHRWKAISRWHTPIVVGAAIAGLQSLIQLYIPKLGWMVADASPEIDGLAVDDQQQLMVGRMQLQPANDDPNEYTYNDAYDAGRFSKQQPGPAQNAESPDVSDLAIDDAMGQSQSLGVFSAN